MTEITNKEVAEDILNEIDKEENEQEIELSFENLVKNTFILNLTKDEILLKEYFKRDLKYVPKSPNTFTVRYYYEQYLRELFVNSIRPVIEDYLYKSHAGKQLTDNQKEAVEKKITALANIVVPHGKVRIPSILVDDLSMSDKVELVKKFKLDVNVTKARKRAYKKSLLNTLATKTNISVEEARALSQKLATKEYINKDLEL